jgi:hypothetical protein
MRHIKVDTGGEKNLVQNSTAYGEKNLSDVKDWSIQLHSFSSVHFHILMTLHWRDVQSTKSTE